MRRSVRWLLLLALLFVVCLIAANLSSNKIIKISMLEIDGGFVIFPIIFVINNVITEVYGTRVAKNIIWFGLLSNIVFSLLFIMVVYLPPAEDWPYQSQLESIFATTPRIMIASLISYFISERMNTHVLSRLKSKLHGKFMPVRFAISSLSSSLVDNTLFYFIAFYGAVEFSLLMEMMSVQLATKFILELLFIPIACKVTVHLLKINVEEDDFFPQKVHQMA